MTTLRRHLPALVALAACNLVVFARLVFLSPDRVPYATVPFDFLSQYSVWLVYIGDCFKAGHFPLWSPYVGAGTPFFINPQSQLYSPLTLLVAPTLGYTQRVAQLQSVFVLFLGGAGAYALSYALWRSRWAGLLTAVCFNFTSAVFGNLEHTTIISSAALMPWLFFATVRTARDGRAWAYLVLAFFIYFLITSGYPGVILMALLWLGVCTLYLILTRAPSWGERVRLALRHAAAWALGLGLAGAHWIPIVIHRKEFTRGAPMHLDLALIGGNLFFKHLWGMLFLFMAEHPLPGADADVSMRGVYFGALALPLALAALLLIRERIVPALALLSLAAFLMACGGWFFGRVFLHIIFPVLNMSRFPAADSRSLMVLGLALLAGGGLTLLQAGDANARALIFRATVGLLAALALGLYGLRAVYPADVYNQVVMNFTTAELLFVAAALVALRVTGGRRLAACLVALLVLEMGTCVLANRKVVEHNVTSIEGYRAARARHRRDFTPEAAALPRVADGGKEFVSEASGRGYLEKSFYLSEYNPLRLHRFENLIGKGFAEWMTTGPRVASLPPDTWPGTYEEFAALARPVEYTILSYTPNEVVYRVRVAEDSTLVFNEIYFPGWRARVDGERAPLGEISGGLRALRVAAGEHTVVTAFNPSSFYWGIGVSLLSAAVFLLWAALIFRRHRRRAAPPGHLRTSTA